VVKKKLKDVR
jgi:hypothetical protein